MEFIQNIEELKAALSKENLSQYRDSGYDAEFARIARSLFSNFAIQSAGKVYRFVEIEFYLNATDSKPQKDITYKRTAGAGDWLVHYSGFDLCFESDDDWFGGILIRAVKEGDYEDGNGFIYGPLKCLTKIFCQMSAFDPHRNAPEIIESRTGCQEELVPERFTRHGISEERSKLKYRFTIPLGMWRSYGSYSAFPGKK